MWSDDRKTITATLKASSHGCGQMIARAIRVAEFLRLDATYTDELDAPAWNRTYQRMLDAGLSRETVKTYVAAFRALMRVMDVDTSKWPRTPKPPRVKAREPIGLQDYNNVLAYLHRNAATHQTADLAEILNRTGMRVDREALAKSYVLTTSGNSVLIIGKGGHERTIPVDRCVWQALWDWRTRNTFSYETHARNWSEAVKACGVESKLPTLHSIRHKYATDAMARCQNLEVVRQMMGHASITTTARYIGVDLAAMRQALGMET